MVSENAEYVLKSRWTLGAIKSALNVGWVGAGLVLLAVLVVRPAGMGLYGYLLLAGFVVLLLTFRMVIGSFREADGVDDRQPVMAANGGDRETQLMAVLESMPITLNAIDLDGNITDSLGSGLESMDLKAGDLVGGSYRTVRKDQPRLVAAFENAIAGSRQIVRMALAKGTEYEFTFFPAVDDSGKVLSVLEISVDETEMFQIEENRKSLKRRVAQSQRMESLGALAAGIAHDFNNYLMAILSFSESADLHMTKKPVLEAIDIVKLKEVCGEIRKTAIEAAGVCQQMLMCAGKSRESKSLCDINQVIRRTQPILAATLPKATSLKLNLSDGKQQVIADDVLIQRMLVNMVKNAGDAIGNHPGRVSITTTERDCTIGDLVNFVGGSEFEGTKRFCCMEIEDDGCGISHEAMLRIFDPYFSTKSNGHGFGLSISSGIVASHSGFIQCRSEPDEGAKFEILLPIAEVSAEDVGGQVSGLDATGTPRKLLIVDDEEAIRKSLQLVLETQDHDVHLAADGPTALQMLSSAEPSFDCVILDYSMPEMNGWEVLQSMRFNQIMVPVVLSSGFLSEAEERSGWQPDEFLAKPYEMASLVTLIDRLCVKPVS